MLITNALRYLNVSKNKSTRMELLHQWTNMKYFNDDQLKVIRMHISRLEQRGK